MGSPLLRPVAPRSGVRTWLARRQNGRGLAGVCLAHRIDPAAAEAVGTLRGLRHGHLGRTLGVATIDDHPHVLTALEPRESLSRLRDRLARAGRPGLPLPVVLRAAAQAAAGLAFLHARGATHGAVDARRVAIGYSGGALVLDTALSVDRGVAPADDVAALGRLIGGLLHQPPAPVADLVRRVSEGGFTRAADVAAALDAWRLADPKCAGVEDAQIHQWMVRACGARWAIWKQAAEATEVGPRMLDGLAALLGAPREAPILPGR